MKTHFRSTLHVSIGSHFRVAKVSFPINSAHYRKEKHYHLFLLC